MVLPIIAAAIPYIAGGVAAAGTSFGLSKLFGGGGKKPKTKKLPTDTPEQIALKKAINEGVLEGKGPLADLFKGFDQGEFNKGIREPSLKNFKENILPQILEKYNANNASFGSARLNAELKANERQNSDLNQLEYQARQNAQNLKSNNVLNALGLGIGSKGFENLHTTGYPSTSGNFAAGASEGAGKFVSNAVNDYINQPPAPGSGYNSSVNAANQVAVGGIK